MVQNVDYGWIETVPLKSLCELPPGLSDLPPQVMQSKLAGIQKRPGLQRYPDVVRNMLIAVKKKREVFCYSTIHVISVWHPLHVSQNVNESLIHCETLD